MSSLEVNLLLRLVGTIGLTKVGQVQLVGWLVGWSVGLVGQLVGLVKVDYQFVADLWQSYSQIGVLLG